MNLKWEIQTETSVQRIMFWFFLSKIPYLTLMLWMSLTQTWAESSTETLKKYEKETTHLVRDTLEFIYTLEYYYGS